MPFGWQVHPVQEQKPEAGLCFLFFLSRCGNTSAGLRLLSKAEEKKEQAVESQIRVFRSRAELSDSFANCRLSRGPLATKFVGFQGFEDAGVAFNRGILSPTDLCTTASRPPKGRWIQTPALDGRWRGTATSPLVQTEPSRARRWIIGGLSETLGPRVAARHPGRANVMSVKAHTAMDMKLQHSDTAPPASRPDWAQRGERRRRTFRKHSNSNRRPETSIYSRKGVL